MRAVRDLREFEICLSGRDAGAYRTPRISLVDEARINSNNVNGRILDANFGQFSSISEIGYQSGFTFHFTNPEGQF